MKSKIEVEYSLLNIFGEVHFLSGSYDSFTYIR